MHVTGIPKKGGVGARGCSITRSPPAATKQGRLTTKTIGMRKDSKVRSASLFLPPSCLNMHTHSLSHTHTHTHTHAFLPCACAMGEESKSEKTKAKGDESLPHGGEGWGKTFRDTWEEKVAGRHVKVPVTAASVRGGLLLQEQQVFQLSPHQHHPHNGVPCGRSGHTKRPPVPTRVPCRTHTHKNE